MIEADKIIGYFTPEQVLRRQIEQSLESKGHELTLEEANSQVERPIQLVFWKELDKSLKKV